MRCEQPHRLATLHQRCSTRCRVTEERLPILLLTRQWRDTDRGTQLVFWAASDRGPVRVVMPAQRPVCFVKRDADLRAVPTQPASRRPVELRTLANVPVDAIYFDRQGDLQTFRQQARTLGEFPLESDIKPHDRFLMERFVRAHAWLTGSATLRDGYLEFVAPRVRPFEPGDDAGPDVRVASLDIETVGRQNHVISIALTTPDRSFAVVRRHPHWSTQPRLDAVDVHVVDDEAQLLTTFFEQLTAVDPDVLIGWNVIAFDLEVLQRRAEHHQIPFAMGRGRDRAAVLLPSGAGQRAIARLPGRAVIDGIDTLRTATWTFEDFSLEAVAHALLGRGKEIDAARDKAAEIERMHAEDPEALLTYNVADCRLVAEIFERTHLTAFAIERAELTGLELGRSGGSAAALDHLYLPRLHREGFVAPDVGANTGDDASPGGYVLDSAPGLHDNVIVLDFKSLYPSLIRTFFIDPLGLHCGSRAPAAETVPGFLGATFSRSRHILPELIRDLWRARDEAKARRDVPSSTAIKIIMNSFYGVLGSQGCRFFDPRLASSITRRGHEVLQQTRDELIRRGHEVIYGDTDSVFAKLGPAVTEAQAREIGTELATSITEHWRNHLRTSLGIESQLELEFETLYVKFFMPTMRGSATGSKKRYAGLVRDDDGNEHIKIRGLEAVRSDWTPLARRVQQEVFRLVFRGEPVDAYLQEMARQLYAGELDTELIYRKRLRRRLDEYTTNVPPHVQAARKAGQASRWIRYIMTARGPEPVEGEPLRPDYEHYVNRQISPAVDPILATQGWSFAAIAGRQVELF